MPKVSEAHRERVRDRILDAAIDCFSTRGIRATTMSDIIKASGLSSGAIYGYFDGKQDLSLAVMRRVTGRRSADVVAAADTSDGPLSPAGIIRALTAGFERDRVPLSIVVQLWTEAMNDEEFRTIAQGAFAEFQAIFGEYLHRWATSALGFGPADAERWSQRMVPVLLALAQGLIIQRQALRTLDREAYLDAVDELFSAGEPGTDGIATARTSR